jgi:membrane-associated phospholipid phosphatase
MYDFGGDLNRFQNWYELVHLDRDNVFAGIKTDHTKSFPSAHTSYTSSFLTLAFLPLFCNKFKTKK